MSDAIRRELGPDLASLLDDCAADIVTIIVFIFRGGDDPPDACTLIPAIWSCP